MKYLIDRNFSSNINTMSFIKKDSVPLIWQRLGLMVFKLSVLVNGIHFNMLINELQISSYSLRIPK
jgi:hypothetical protein